MIFSREFRMMAQEGHLASASLLAGFEALTKLNYDKPGTVYLSLFHLATGLERILKIAFVLDYKAKNRLASPSDRQLKELGHSITDIYTTLHTIAGTYSITNGWFTEHTEHCEVLRTLSEFARFSRYYNLDQLVSGRDSPDPLTRWFSVHMKIAYATISKAQLNGIMERARNHCEAHGLLGWEMGPTGQWDLNVDVIYQLEIARVSRGHCVWTIIQILEPIYRLIEHLENKIHQIEMLVDGKSSTTPYMTEFFPFCLTNRSVAIRRKSWTTLFHIAGRV
ncbi:MAG: hypothetical protein P4L54_10790 [Acidocella sp.]|nr:hypothetical protein [Acidocella sp.]